jgi:queuosine precursor transporter
MGKAMLTVWVALQAVLANLFVIKQITFFQFHVTCSDVFAIGSLFGLNLLREYFGKEAAVKALWACFFAMVFFVAMAQIHLLYLPSVYDTTHDAFVTTLSSSWRLLSASIAVFFFVQKIDLHFFGFLKDKASTLSFGLRSAICIGSTQALDTVLFSMLGLWGLVENLFDIILISFVIKLLILALMTPMIRFSKSFVKKEGSHDSL